MRWWNTSGVWKIVLLTQPVPASQAARYCRAMLTLTLSPFSVIGELVEIRDTQFFLYPLRKDKDGFVSYLGAKLSRSLAVMLTFSCFSIWFVFVSPSTFFISFIAKSTSPGWATYIKANWSDGFKRSVFQSQLLGRFLPIHHRNRH